MKITTFDPMIITPNAENVMRVFEDLGFEKTHAPVTTTETGDVASFRMKHEDGYHVDVADLKQIPKDMTYIRMNVDNFEEAYDFLLAHGFKNAQGEKVTDTGSSRATLMVSPTGFAISLAQHIRKKPEEK